MRAISCCYHPVKHNARFNFLLLALLLQKGIKIVSLSERQYFGCLQSLFVLFNNLWFLFELKLSSILPYILLCYTFYCDFFLPPSIVRHFCCFCLFIRVLSVFSSKISCLFLIDNEKPIIILRSLYLVCLYPFSRGVFNTWL